MPVGWAVVKDQHAQHDQEYGIEQTDRIGIGDGHMRIGVNYGDAGKGTEKGANQLQLPVIAPRKEEIAAPDHADNHEHGEKAADIAQNRI
ncbi:hypothetical protein GCM10007913_38520 [Devosia yakushimensis]|uniref:Uncharacterized protein n=1 Tax=Devosia yakushimensis TaxID=470028 RepID=A0ABQ5UL60_9HYPH|nr:hypothetical protein GCM10007913_38520 [Devosia yakushimensis]